MTIKRLRDDEKGSILILTMLALVGAISIAVAMSSISIVERKMTTKSRKSTTAFQSANSGIEWAMKMINDAEGIANENKTIEDVFGPGELDSTNGQIDCPNGDLFSDTALKCKITLLKRDSTVGSSTVGERVFIDDENDSMESIEAIRSAGTFGTDTERVGRALEAYAMPNCGGTSERVADFCIDDDDKDSEGNWGAAVTVCESAGKRLCTAAELVAASQAGLSITDLLSADVTGYTGGGEYAIVDGSNIDSVSDGTGEDFRCCRNR